jgi:hypothetical protein
MLVEKLEKSSCISMRGFLPNKELQDASIARIFSAVLCTGVVMDSDFTTDDEKKALSQCFHSGWLHTDKLDDVGRRYKFGYFFASSLHHWYVEWKLWDNIPGIPFIATNILDFVVDVIHEFSPCLLTTEQMIGPSYIQSLPKAQYQDKFYHCCHSRANGSLVTFPEFGISQSGRADFYIPAKQWGVELLRNGDQLEQHSGRFSQSESYETVLPLSNYIILDCRDTRPTTPYPCKL